MDRALANNAAVKEKSTGLKLTLKAECWTPKHAQNCHEESLNDSLPEKLTVLTPTWKTKNTMLICPEVLEL